MAKHTTQKMRFPRQERTSINKEEVTSEQKEIVEDRNRRRCKEAGSRRSITSRKDPQSFSMFESSTLYILDDVNSIAYANERFYNLLKVRPRNLWGRQVRCKCPRSRCEARYCECFSHGQVCGVECSCVNCGNNEHQKHLNTQLSNPKEEMGCRCSKSECLKNYCECFQRGLSCTDKCRCSNCRNSL